MKIFQIIHKYASYIPIFESKFDVDSMSFEATKRTLINEGFYACHILKPLFEENTNCFYTIHDYEKIQEKWAKENNLVYTDLKDILKAQIEKHQPDVIYNMSPQHINFEFFNQLSFKPKIVCWNADPYSIGKLDFSEYDALFTSSILKQKELENAYLHYPSHDPLMENININKKDIDVFFYGQYDVKVFDERNKALEMLARFLSKNGYNFKIALSYKPWQKPMINRKFLWKIPWLQHYYPSLKLREHSSAPVYGIDVYKHIKRSKIIFNMSGGLKEFGAYKFNMRMFESLGLGSFMLSDEGTYPEHFKMEQHFDTYKSLNDLKQKIKFYLKEDKQREAIAKAGKEMIRKHYSKEGQFENFCNVINSI